MRHRLLPKDIEIGATYRGGTTGARRKVKRYELGFVQTTYLDACGPLPAGRVAWVNRTYFANWVNLWRRLEYRRVGGAHG